MPRKCSVDECEAPHRALGFCRRHENRMRRTGTLEARQYVYHQNGDTRLTPDGYVEVYQAEHPSAHKGWVLEHRIVMERMLGRLLFPGENVHHKNGLRADNRQDNLELWAVAQPYGQRVEDLVQWAREILDRYAYLEGAS